MPLKTLVAVALRLYAIYYLVSGVSACVTYAPIWFTYAEKMSGTALGESRVGKILASGIVSILASLSIGFVLWFLAYPLANRVTKRYDGEVSLGSLARNDLYHFAFVFLGLYFFLSSLHSLVYIGHQFYIYDFPLTHDNPQKGQYLWPLIGHIVVLAAGFASMLGAGRWTTKLLRHEQKADAAGSVK